MCSYCSTSGHNIRTCEIRKRSEAQADQQRAEAQADQQRAEAQVRWGAQTDELLEPRIDNVVGRMVALPVLRETAVEATECPICIEDLGEVGKTVLKCGHTLCVSCFLQQMMRATATTMAHECKCPVCRVSYIM